MWTGYNTKLGNNDNFVVWGNSILVIKKKTPNPLEIYVTYSWIKGYDIWDLL